MQRRERQQKLLIMDCIFVQAVPGVPKITEGYNPATWMLEVTSPLAEARLNVDFAEIYANSALYR
jgi:hypothetical protein